MSKRTTRDLCQDCWQDVHPDIYTPQGGSMWDRCQRCSEPAMLYRSKVSEEVKDYA